MFEVFERSITGRKVVLATKDNFNQALSYVEDLGAIYTELDSEYEGCADAYLNNGQVIAVQPVGFKL